MDVVHGENQYGRYSIPAESMHRPAARTILAGDVWEPTTAALIAESSRRGDVVTAGAYFGDMLPAAASGGNVVYAAEPNPVNFEAARTTLDLNAIANVRLLNGAYGAATGTARLEIAGADGTAHGGGSWIAPRFGRRRSRGQRVACSVVRIDDVVSPDRVVSLIHLDVERYEGRALAGAMATIERCRPDLILEWRPRVGRVARRLRELGYEPAAEMDGNVLLRPSR